MTKGRKQMLNATVASNVGQMGVDSIRLKDMTLDQLPIAEAAHAKRQIPLLEAQEVQNKIAAVLGKYPRHNVQYLKARINEANQNAKRMNDLKKRETDRIEEYVGLIAQCKMRDQELATTRSSARIKAIKARYPLYNVAKMEEQVVLSRDSIKRADEVIEQENGSVIELRGVLSLCEQRDAELRALGAKVE